MLPTRAPYSHPYEPYPIQVQLMDAIYDTLQNNYKVGIFESPTGTGKTLSIICSTMTWLRENKQLIGNNNAGTSSPSGSDNDDSDDDEPEWVKQAYSKIRSGANNELLDFESYLDKLEKFEYGKTSVHRLTDKLSQKSKRLKSDSANGTVKNEDLEFLLDDYVSDSETGLSNTLSKRNDALNKEISSLLYKVEGHRSRDTEFPVPHTAPKILFTSRTHSQLNQFTHQLALTSFAPSFDGVKERTKYIPLGSRKQLCVNKQVLQLKNDTMINESCRELQAKEESARCHYLASEDVPETMAKFKKLSLVKVHDIEELNTMGLQMKVCPYYSLRSALDPAEVVSLPYQLLLQDASRSTLDLTIDNSVIVVDEAHNLLDVINAMNSTCITLEELRLVMGSLKTYISKFSRRLNSGNRVNLLKLLKMIQLLVKFIESNQDGVKEGDEIDVHSIFSDSTGDLLNIFKLETFLQKSKIAFKIESYIEFTNADSSANYKKSLSNPLLFKLTKFLKCLTNPSKEGKLFWSRSNGAIGINYMLLDPSQTFKDIVDRCKCIILCGGTMEPMSDYMEYLFPYVSPSKINTFTCNHVIPDSNLEVFAVSQFKGSKFEFLFEKRNNQLMLQNLGEFIIQLCESIPHGIVVFVPSYKYLAKLLDTWKLSGQLSRFKKKVFQESNASTKSEGVLEDYTLAINDSENAKGAILFSVVGGKLSEGINFSDQLARAVVMLGLPYPNAYLGEIVARRKFIERRTLEQGGSMKTAQEKLREFYDNICMRAVNQSVGRSIRHIRDYSIIYLIDGRYESPRIQLKLSGWVKKRIQSGLTTEDMIARTKEFFNCCR